MSCWVIPSVDSVLPGACIDMPAGEVGGREVMMGDHYTKDLQYCRDELSQRDSHTCELARSLDANMHILYSTRGVYLTVIDTTVLQGHVCCE